MIKLLLSIIYGALIGFEREKHGRPAGIRTHSLVSLGSCLTMQVSIHMYDLFKVYNTINYSSGVDPSRIASMVMTGIGFIGAGVILKTKRGNIWGLTSAACLWISASIGLAIGCGYIELATITVLLAISVLLGIKYIEKYLIKDKYYKVELKVVNSLNPIDKIERLFKVFNITIVRKAIKINIVDKTVNYCMTLKSKEEINSYVLKKLTDNSILGILEVDIR